MWFGAALIFAALTGRFLPKSNRPGQCGQGIRLRIGRWVLRLPGPMAPGTHCETVYVLGFGGTNCFNVRPVPVSVDHVDGCPHDRRRQARLHTAARRAVHRRTVYLLMAS